MISNTDFGGLYGRIVQAMYTQSKLRKYRILSRFPGRVGRIYNQKLERANNYEATQKRSITALRLCSGLACVDIGANVGNYTKLMAPYAGHVFAFEPDPLAFSALKTSTAGLHNVTLFEAAAGSSNDNIRLYRTNRFQKDPHNQTQASSLFMGSHIDQENSVEIAQINIVAFLAELNSEIGVIKIDAEGAEVPILEELLDNQSLLDRIHFIFAETHERFFPEFVSRYEKLRQRAALSKKPFIDLSWH